MRPRLALVGEAPSRTSDPLLPITSGRSGRWLRWLLGEDAWARLRERTLFVNVLDGYPGPRFPLADARVHADLLTPTLPERVVMLGRNVADAFFRPDFDAPWFEWRVAAEPSGLRRFAAVPHPSGLNRWWNDEGNRGVAKAFLLSLLEEVAS